MCARELTVAEHTVPKNNLNIGIKTEPLTDGAVVITVSVEYIYCTERRFIVSGSVKEYLWIKNLQQTPSSLLNLSFALESRKL